MTVYFASSGGSDLQGQGPWLPKSKFAELSTGTGTKFHCNKYKQNVMLFHKV